MSGSDAGPTEVVRCSSCGRDVPEGEFCGACGAHLETGHGVLARRYRYHAFAANPAEHVLHPSVSSTLFPHLPHRRAVPFRLALLLAVGVLLVLSVLRWTGPAIAAAALLMPLLYLLYVYEVEVYEDEPITVAATVVVGAILGVGWALVTGPLITRSAIQNITLGAAPDRVLLVGVLLPLAAQVIMLIGPLAIYATRPFDEVLDGVSFGVASALGFTAAVTVVNLLPALQTGPVAHIPLLTSLVDVLQRGLLVPLINAGTTGLIAGALWLHRGPVRRFSRADWVASLAVAVGIAAAVHIVLGLCDTLLNSLAYIFVVRIIVAAVLMLLARVVIHHMLLMEAVTAEIGPYMPCSHCHHIVPRMAFCPVCGVATRATPKTGSGRTARVVR